MRTKAEDERLEWITLLRAYTTKSFSEINSMIKVGRLGSVDKVNLRPVSKIKRFSFAGFAINLSDRNYAFRVIFRQILLVIDVNRTQCFDEEVFNHHRDSIRLLLKNFAEIVLRHVPQPRLRNCVAFLKPKNLQVMRRNNKGWQGRLHGRSECVKVNLIVGWVANPLRN